MIKISSQIRAKRPEYQLTYDQLRFDLLFYKPKSHARVVGNEGPPLPSQGGVLGWISKEITWLLAIGMKQGEM